MLGAIHPTDKSVGFLTNSVKQVEFHLLIEFKIAPAADLPEAGDARLRAEAAAVPVLCIIY